MKKIITMLFILLGISIFGDENGISQAELLKKYTSALEKSPVYEKFVPVYGRKAKMGEKIATVTKDGLETINTAKSGDYIVKNQTDAKEEYIVPAEKFEKRYVLGKKIDGTWNEYRPFGEIKAIKISSKKEFYIAAPWGEKMVVKDGDYLVSPLNYSEVYRIANHEFHETYRLKK